MDGSSKEGANANKKVVVVKCNEFFPINVINTQKAKEKVDGLKGKILLNKASYISQIHNQNSTGSSDRTTSQPVAGAAGALSLLKDDKVEEVLKKKYILKNGLDNVKILGFVNLPQVSKSGNVRAEKSGENSNINGHLNAEMVIDLVNKKCGDFLETQIPFFKQNNTTEKSAKQAHVEDYQTRPCENNLNQDRFPKPPSDLCQYRAKEEDFLEELDNKQNIDKDIVKAKEYLESIIILDSPEKNDELFTPEELKTLPEKIFRSPPTALKKETLSPKKEDLKNHDQNTEIDIPLQNLMIITENNADSCREKVKKNIWGTESNSDKINTVIDHTNLNHNNNESPQVEESSNTKSVGMSDEDIIIFEEMDKFIEEIKMKNESLASPNAKEEEKENLNDTGFEGNDAEHNYANGTDDVIIIYEDKSDSEKTEDTTNTNSMNNESETDDEECSDVKGLEKLILTVDSSDNIENVTSDCSFIKEKIISPCKSNITTIDIAEETEMEISKAINKSGEVTEITIVENKLENCLEDKTEVESEVIELTEDAIENIVTVICEQNKLDDIVSCLFANAGCLENNTKTESEVLSTDETNKKEDITIKYDENELEDKSSQHICDNTNCPQNETKNESKLLHEDEDKKKEDIVTMYCDPEEKCTSGKTISENECSIHIVKNDGTTDKDVEPCIVYEDLHRNQSPTTDAKQTDVSKDKKKAKSVQAKKEEILILLEKAKAVQLRFGDNYKEFKDEKEKLKLLSGAIKEHVKLYKKMFERLEVFVETAEEKLKKRMKRVDISMLQDNLVFVKNVVDSCFVKDETKKLKYKVIRVTKKINDKKLNSPKQKSVTKKIYSKKVGKSPMKLSRSRTRRLSQNTLYRINKLLDAIEKNQKLLLNARRHSANKLKGTVGIHLNDKDKRETRIGRSISADSNNSTTKNDFQDSANQILEKTKFSDTNLKTGEPSELSNVNKKLLTPVPCKNKKNESSSSSSTFDRVDTKRSVKEKSDNDNENKLINKKERSREDCIIKQKYSPRYSLRSRNSRRTNLLLDESPKQYKGRSTSKVGEHLSYEVNYRNVADMRKNKDKKLDYILQNDNKPSVVLYHKTRDQNVTSNKVKTPPRKQNCRFEGDDPGNKQVINRYETRSKELKKRSAGEKALRCRKI